MASNIYFQNSTADQKILNDINREIIQQAGMDVYYLPRTLVKEDLIMGEDVLSKFTTSYLIEMYIKSSDAFGGPDDSVSKFGLDIVDQIILTVHKEQFTFVTGMKKPLEGDLIYFPLQDGIVTMPSGEGLFVINFVEDEQPFYQLGKNYVFDLTCEIFDYSGERLQTGTTVDSVEQKYSPSMFLLMGLGGTSNFTVGEEVYQGSSLAEATAKAIVVSWVPSTMKLRVNHISGSFVVDNLIGETSGASWSLVSYDDQLLPSTPFADNKTLEVDGDNVLDFSEVDPWSEGDL